MIDSSIHLTKADNASYNEMAQMLKAATSYTPPSIGRIIAVFAKAIELQQLIEHLDHDQNLSACDTSGHSATPEEIIRDLRNYCNPEDRKQLDRCMNMMNIMKMYDMYNNIFNFSDQNVQSAAPNDYFQKMQSMLTPEQKQMLKNMNQSQNPE